MQDAQVTKSLRWHSWKNFDFEKKSADDKNFQGGGGSE